MSLFIADAAEKLEKKAQVWFFTTQSIQQPLTFQI